MRKGVLKVVLASVIAIFVAGGFVGVPVFAEGTISEEEKCEESGGVITSIIGGGGCYDGGINGILHLVINIMSGIIGVLAVAGMVFSGLQYSTSAGDAAKMAKAKNRIVQIVIGLIVYAVMWAILDFLIPGGILAG